MQKKQKSPDKDWKTFSNWERTYKSKNLKELTIDSAFAIFSELWDLQNFLKVRGVPYMIIGGIGNLVWGEPRMTVDIDDCGY